MAFRLRVDTSTLELVWWIFFLLACLVVGLGVAKFWLVPLPLIFVWSWDAATAPHDPNDDLRGFGNLLMILIGTFVVVVGIVVGRMARTPGRRPEG